MTSALARSVGSYARRPASERRLIREALAAVAVVRIGLTLFPYRLLRRFGAPVRRLATRFGRAGGTPEELSAAVRVASRHVPRATCLTQALALDLLLRRRGLAGRLVIGTAPGRQRFGAHAWLELGGDVLIGGNVEDYRPFTKSRNS